ncbi:MAG: hypothetical protein QXF09_03790 [Nitrososphaerota archaeon]
MEELEVYENGKIIYKDLKTRGKIEINLDEKLIKLLKYLHNEIIKTPPIKIEAKMGAADFFTHKLTINGKNFEWVDTWAAEKEIPNEILEFHTFISMIFMDKVKKSFTNYIMIAEKDNIRIEAELNNYYYAKNEPINIKITIRNIGDETINYSSPTPCHPDILINSDLEYDLEFIKPKFSKETICIQVIEERKIEPNSFIENIAIITFKNSGIAHVSIRFPLASFEKEIATLTMPLFISD